MLAAPDLSLTHLKFVCMLQLGVKQIIKVLLLLVHALHHIHTHTHIHIQSNLVNWSRTWARDRKVPGSSLDNASFLSPIVYSALPLQMRRCLTLHPSDGM